MRWENLFDDLEAQLDDLFSADVDVRDEEERFRLGQLSLRQRMHALRSSKTAQYPVTITLGTQKRIDLQIRTVGKDWIAGDLLSVSGSYTQCVVPLHGVSTVTMDRAQVRQSLSIGNDRTPSSRADAITFAIILRDLCRRRCFVEFELHGCFVYGTIDRVGSDHCDLAVHDPGTTRWEGNIRGIRLIPLSEVVVVRL